MSKFVSCDDKKLQGSWIQFEAGGCLGLVDDKSNGQQYVCYHPDQRKTNTPYAIYINDNNEAVLQLPAVDNGVLTIPLETLGAMLASARRLFPKDNA